MGLGEIAAGIEVVDEQRDRGVAAVDRTAESLDERLAEYADEFPCTPAEAATLVEAYAGGKSVGASARAAGLPPVTGAKTLHLFGEQVTPLGPTAREVVRDWLAGHLSRAEALELIGASEREFALAAYVETHDPIPGARDAVEGVLSTSDAASVEKRDALAGTMSDTDDLL
jgi:hypothetical protein